MQIQTLTDAQYKDLREKLHHIHDKIWKIIFMSIPAVREFILKVIAPKLPNIILDLEHLELDNTTYLTQKLEPFYSDLVYTTTFRTLDGVVKPIKIAFLFEHKSKMPTSLLLRLQLLVYMSAIQLRTYDSDTDETLLVIPTVFNQFDKRKPVLPMRDCFEHIPVEMRRFVSEFDLLEAHLQDFSEAFINEFERYGEMRAGLLAMKHARNKVFLLENFEEIFVFLERHPHKSALRNQLVTYLIGSSELTKDDLEALLRNILSPILKKEVMLTGTGFIAVAAREAAEKAALETEIRVRKELEKERFAAIQLKARTLIMRSWKKEISVEAISDISEVPIHEVETLIKGFEAAKAYIAAQKRVTVKQIVKLTKFSDEEAAVLLKLLLPK